MSEIGDRVRAHRNAMGISQVDLAETLGISKSYLSHIEAGRRRVPPGLAELIFRTIGYDEEKLHTFLVTVQAPDLGTPPMGVKVKAKNFRAALHSAADFPTSAWIEMSPED